MRYLSLLAFILLSGCAGPSPYKDTVRVEDAPIRSFDVPTVERLGRQMFVLDAMAAQASDAMKAAGHVKGKEDLRGWIVELTSAVGRVRYLRERNGTLEAAYDIDFVPGTAPHLAVAASPLLTSEEIAQFNAQLLALNNIDRPCSQAYNPVAIKDPESNGWLVWALAATTQSGVVIVGGHYRFTISADGKTIIRKDALSRGCLNLPISDDPAKGRPVALFSVQLVSNEPLETEVYLSLLHHMPLMIAMPDRKIWTFESGTVSDSGHKVGEH